MATDSLESPTQPLLRSQDGGDLITQPSSQTETVSWAQPWSPQPWAHRLSPQETLTCVLQIQYIQREIPPDRSHPSREQHQGLWRAGALPSCGDTGCVWPCGFCGAAAGKGCLMRAESSAPHPVPSALSEELEPLSLKRL